MCVIIIREPGATIPLDKLSLACSINKDGHGIAYVHRKRLRREVSIDVNDPEQIQKKLTELKDYRVFLHLRHATVGDVSFVNAHPFNVLEYRQDGIDLGFMHNGTLHPWSPAANANPDNISDSRNFCEGFVQPMAARSRAFVQGSPLRDHFFSHQINRELRYSQSTLLFFDSHGNARIFNEDPWVEFEGWKASNSYSFQENHYRNKKYDNMGSGGGYSGGSHSMHKHWEAENDETPFGAARSPASDSLARIPVLVVDPDKRDWEKEWTQALAEVNQTDGVEDRLLRLVNHYKTTPIEQLHKEMATVKQHLTTALMDKPENSMNSPEMNNLFVSRPSFKEQMEMDDITDMENLPEESFVALCKSCPNAMAQAFIDLASELRRVRTDLAAAKKTGAAA